MAKKDKRIDCNCPPETASASLPGVRKLYKFRIKMTPTKGVESLHLLLRNMTKRTIWEVMTAKEMETLVVELRPLGIEILDLEESPYPRTG